MLGNGTRLHGDVKPVGRPRVFTQLGLLSHLLSSGYLLCSWPLKSGGRSGVKVRYQLQIPHQTLKVHATAVTHVCLLFALQIPEEKEGQTLH